MVELIRNADIDFLIGIVIGAPCFIACVIIELKSWITKGHSALF